MAFYFALMNISNANVDNSTKPRSSSLSRNHQVQRSNRRRCTITSYDAGALFKQERLSPQIYRSQHEFHEVQRDSKLKNDIQEKKVTFEKRESETTAEVNNLLKNQAFLEHPVPTFHSANVEHKQQNAVKKSLSIWKTPSYGDVIGAWLLNTKKSNSRSEVNEGYPLGFSAFSDHVQGVNDRIVAPSTVQNVANELIEHKLILSAPLRRRNFWKSTTLSRRRSSSDSYSKYTRSYFNSAFHFVEDEFKVLENDDHAAIPADENYIFSSYIYSKRLPLADDCWRIR
uniref:DEP domain-containing protein n=1 Tax=Elaeophora elaphi TaxID=1147741 RepID=A0A0R3S0H2_9BILA